MRFALVLPLVVVLALASSGAPAWADEVKVDAAGRVLVFGDGVAKFHTNLDRSAGRMTFVPADPNVKIVRAPVATIQTTEGPRQVTLTAVEGRPGSWVLVHDALRQERFDGTMAIVVADKTYSAPLIGQVGIVARHGGRVVSFDACSAHVEVVQDLSTGTLTIYSPEDVKIAGAPEITITETKGPVTTQVVPVEGQPGVWKVTHTAFKTTTTTGKIKVLVNGKPCEAPLSFSRGGRIVQVQNGPRFEIVPDPVAKHYTFYALDETIDGKAYTIEDPQVIVTTAEGPRTVVLQPVPNEPRAWRLIGMDAQVSRPLDGMLRFTLFGRSLETNLGVSGVGIGVR